MRTLLAAVAVLGLGCGPEDQLAPEVANAQQAATEEVIPQPETTLRLQVVNTEQGLAFRLVNDPVEERFFREVDVTQPPPPMPMPPCPVCR
jgi:hypothetical protein